MAQFLSIPVTDEGNQLISARGVLLVDSAAGGIGTATTIHYDGGKVTTLTHAAAVAFDVRDAIQDALVLAHKATTAPDVVISVTMPKAVSGIATA